MIECLSCLPCCSAKKVAEGAMKGRDVCPGWRMAPGVLALAACVVGVVYCLMKKNPYLCIPFGVGGAASLYFIYLGYQYKDLQSLHQSSQQLEAANKLLKIHVTDIERTNASLHESCSSLSTSSLQLQTQVLALQSTAQTRQAQLQEQKFANAALALQADEMRQGLTRMQAHLQSGEGNLDQLRQVLTDFQGERAELTGVRDTLIAVLQPIKPQEYRDACEAFGELQGKIKAAETSLPELKELVEAQKRLKEGYESLLNRAATFFQHLESQGKALFDKLGEQADDFRQVQTEFQQILKEFKSEA